MKHNFTVRQGTLEHVEVFLNVAQHRNFRKAATRTQGDPIGDQPGGICVHSRRALALRFYPHNRSVGA